eukprot:257327-Pleurochrysis_carterae.AAC.1
MGYRRGSARATDVAAHGVQTWQRMGYRRGSAWGTDEATHGLQTRQHTGYGRGSERANEAAAHGYSLEREAARARDACNLDEMLLAARAWASRSAATTAGDACGRKTHPNHMCARHIRNTMCAKRGSKHDVRKERQQST